MDAVTLIKNDHRLLESLFEKLRSGDGDRQALLVEVAARLAAHSHAEEMKVYPALAQNEPDGRDAVEHGAEEHHEAEQMLHRLMAMARDDPEFESVVTRFVDAVLEHVREEEDEILPALQRAVDAAQLEQLGQAFEDVRSRELEVAGISAEAPSSDRRSGDRTGGMSRTELYEQAKEAGVPGRSHMSKEELAQALHEEGKA